MIQLLHSWFLAMLVPQIPSVLFMACQQPVIFDLFYRNYFRHSVVEWRGCHEFRFDFITLGSIQCNGSQCILRSFGRAGLVTAPTRTYEPQVLTSAISCNPFFAAM